MNGIMSMSMDEVVCILIKCLDDMTRKFDMARNIVRNRFKTKLTKLFVLEGHCRIQDEMITFIRFAEMFLNSSKRRLPQLPRKDMLELKSISFYEVCSSGILRELVSDETQVDVRNAFQRLIKSGIHLFNMFRIPLNSLEECTVLLRIIKEHNSRSGSPLNVLIYILNKLCERQLEDQYYDIFFRQLIQCIQSLRNTIQIQDEIKSRLDDSESEEDNFGEEEVDFLAQLQDNIDELKDICEDTQIGKFLWIYFKDFFDDYSKEHFNVNNTHHDYRLVQLERVLLFLRNIANVFYEMNSLMEERDAENNKRFLDIGNTIEIMAMVMLNSSVSTWASLFKLYCQLILNHPRWYMEHVD